MPACCPCRTGSPSADLSVWVGGPVRHRRRVLCVEEAPGLSWVHCVANRQETAKDARCRRLLLVRMNGDKPTFRQYSDTAWWRLPGQPGCHRATIGRERKRNDAVKEGYQPQKVLQRYHVGRKTSVNKGSLDYPPLRAYKRSRITVPRIRCAGTPTSSLPTIPGCMSPRRPSIVRSTAMNAWVSP